MGAWLGCKPGRKDKINVVGLFWNRLEKLLRWWKATEQPLPDTAPLRSLAPPCAHSHGTADLAVYQINSYAACHCQSSTILHQCTRQSHMSLNSARCLILNPTNWTRKFIWSVLQPLAIFFSECLLPPFYGHFIAKPYRSWIVIWTHTLRPLARA
jgi:hypothetical protein